MYEILFKPVFIRQYKKYPLEIQVEIKERIEILKKNPKHPFLKTHKLKGKLSECWSCSVNYNFRIVFEYESDNKIVLLAVGDHDVYK